MSSPTADDVTDAVAALAGHLPGLVVDSRTHVRDRRWAVDPDRAEVYLRATLPEGEWATAAMEALHALTEYRQVPCPVPGHRHHMRLVHSSSRPEQPDSSPRTGTEDA